MALHRIQIDFDIEADSHQAAEGKVLDWWLDQMKENETNSVPQGLHDSLVIEHREETCPTCSPGSGNFYKPV